MIIILIIIIIMMMMIMMMMMMIRTIFLKHSTSLNALILTISDNYRNKNKTIFVLNFMLQNLFPINPKFPVLLYVRICIRHQFYPIITYFRATLNHAPFELFNGNIKWRMRHTVVQSLTQIELTFA